MATTSFETWTDPRDDQTYRTAKLRDGRLWLAESLRYTYGTATAICVEPKDGEKTSELLYDWETAIRACPPGWRLPSSSEWRGATTAHSGVDGATKILSEFGFELTATGAHDGGRHFWPTKACFWSSSRTFSLTRMLPGVSVAAPAAKAVFLLAEAECFEASGLTRFHLAARCVQR